MSTPLRWDNVGGPSLTAANLLNIAGTDNSSGGIEDISKGLTGFNDFLINKKTSRIALAIQQMQDRDTLNADAAAAIAGGDPRFMNNDRLAEVLAKREVSLQEKQRIDTGMEVSELGMEATRQNMVTESQRQTKLAHENRVFQEKHAAAMKEQAAITKGRTNTNDTFYDNFKSNQAAAAQELIESGARVGGINSRTEQTKQDTSFGVEKHRSSMDTAAGQRAHTSSQTNILAFDLATSQRKQIEEQQADAAVAAATFADKDGDLAGQTRFHPELVMPAIKANNLSGTAIDEAVKRLGTISGSAAGSADRADLTKRARDDLADVNKERRKYTIPAAYDNAEARKMTKDFLDNVQSDTFSTTTDKKVLDWLSGTITTFPNVPPMVTWGLIQKYNGWVNGYNKDDLMNFDAEMAKANMRAQKVKY